MSCLRCMHTLSFIQPVLVCVYEKYISISSWVYVANIYEYTQNDCFSMFRTMASATASNINKLDYFSACESSLMMDISLNINLG